jgi:hypothetical protein
MSDTTGVPGYGTKSDQEHIFRIVGRQVNMGRTGALVLVLVQVDIQGLNALAAQVFEAFVAGGAAH